MGACNNSSAAQLVESRTQKPKYMGSNHGVDNKLIDLAMKNNSDRVAAVWCTVEVVRRTAGRTGKMAKGSVGKGND